MTSPTTGPSHPIRDLSPCSAPETEQPPASHQTVRGGHGWMMLICCVPMVAIVVLLVVSGIAGSGALLFAVGCVAMMAAMMFMVPCGHDHR